jgi:hypothetical protein
MTRPAIKVDLIVWIIIHAFGGSSVTSKIQRVAEVKASWRPLDERKEMSMTVPTSGRPFSMRPMLLPIGYSLKSGDM